MIEEDPVPGMVSIFVSSSEEDRQVLQNAINVLKLCYNLISTRKISVLAISQLKSLLIGPRGIFLRFLHGP